MRRLISVVSLWALVAGAVPAVAAPPSAKVPLDYKAYDAWNAIRNVKLSDDGRWLAYALVPEDGDPVLIVRDLTTGSEKREERGLVPTFTADSKFVVFTIRAKNADIHKAEREHKKPDEQPKNGLGILDLTTGSVATYERIKSVAVPHDAGNDTIAFLAEKAVAAPKQVAGSNLPPPPPPPTLTPATPGAAPTAAAPLPSPSPSATPDALHSIEPGTTLTIRDLAAGSDATVKDVSNYAVSHDGAYVAYAVAAKDQTLDSVRIRRSSDGISGYPIVYGAGHYENLTFAPKSELLAFESDRRTFSEKAPHYAVYQVDASANGYDATGTPSRGPGSILPVADAEGPGLPRGWAPSVNAKLEFSKDNGRLFFGTAPAPTPVPSGTPEPVKVSIWSWRDGDLQSYQRKHVEDEQKRTYAAVFLEAATSVHQLATKSMRILRRNQNADYALGADDLPYRKAISWVGEEMEDEYAVSLRDGSRRLLAHKAVDEGNLSPDGRFVVIYDRFARGWYSLRTSDRKRVALTAKLPVAFYDELDDHPFPPPAYQFGGFAGGSRYVLLADRYDIWAIDPADGNARNLTAGYGRAHHLRFAPLQLDAEREDFPLDKNVVLRAFDDETKASGLFVVGFRGADAFAPRKIFMAPKAVGGVQKARDAERIVLTEQRLDEVQNLWTAPSLGPVPLRVSDANPQKAKYVWATDSLIAYKSAWGLPLRGILMVPENFDPHKKYPMLVYLYERFSDDLHAMPFTVPAPGTSPNLLRYVSNGYVVLVPDIAYRTGHPGKSALDCVLPAVAAVVKRGFVDEKRIGVAGHSWGAYQIAYMITKTDRFRAAEAGAAVDDMISAYGGIREGEGLVREFQYEVSQSRIGATPWERTDLYLENSPLFGIANVHTPYLSIANDADDAVPWQQGIEFNTALRRLGKEAYMFEFDGELHNLRGREQQKYWTVHLDEFFDHFLKGAPAPAWMKEETPFVQRGTRNVRTLFGEDP